MILTISCWATLLAAPQNPPSTALVQSFEQAMISSPPKSLALDSFYKKYTAASGIPIVASDNVPDAALLITRDVVNYMLLKRPDVREVMIDRGSRVGIIAHSEMQTDLPEYRDWKKPTVDDRRLTPRERENYDKPGGIASMTDREYWNRRARGMGGRYTTCAEENVLGYPNTRYYGENILVHEFSHGIMSALRTADRQLYQEIQDAYQEAKTKGLFKSHYAENTVAEYWAEGTQWWFWSNYEWIAGESRLQTPDDLKAYDPRLYAILQRVYPGHHIPADVYHGLNLRPSRRRR